MTTRNCYTLTPTEILVLRLVSEGLTNYQISERLSISSRTAENHIDSIYSKLSEYIVDRNKRVMATKYYLENYRI